MPDWQERITRETDPAVRAEHDLRYRLAEPLILASRSWTDLGCGNGVAAADVLEGAYAGRLLLVDVEQAALDRAASAIAAADTETVAADLADPDAVARVRAAILDGATPRVVTCFEVIEHLSAFVPLVAMLSELAEAGEADVLLSVPNDDFWALENPYHASAWGEGSFAELRSVLPASAVVAKQLALQGSGVVVETGDEQRVGVDVELRGDGAVPTHFLAALGPGAGQLRAHAAVAQTDLEERRRWERQRDADNAYFQAAAKRLQEENDAFRAELQKNHSEFEDWRRYIHELEGKLGMPLSGVSRDGDA